MADEKRTDANGEAKFDRILRREAVQIRVRGENIVTGWHTIEPSSGAECEIVVEQRCHFRIESSDSKWANAKVMLESADGGRVWISWRRGTYNETLQLVGGRSAVVTASERAATLIVDGEKRVPLSLVPGEVVVIRF